MQTFLLTCYLIIIFFGKKPQMADVKKIKKRISFSLMKLYTETSVRFLRYLNLTLNNNVLDLQAKKLIALLKWKNDYVSFSEKKIMATKHQLLDNLCEKIISSISEKYF